MSKLIHKYIESTTKALDDERALIVTISTDTPDRYGDVMVPKGAKLDSYRKNPVVLFGHDGNAFPIAKATELIVGDTDIKAKVLFPSEGTHAVADTAYALAKQGFINAWSIGFIPDFSTAERLSTGGHKFLDWELLEFSAVPIPANPEALTIVRSFGLSEDETKQLVADEAETEEVEQEVVAESSEEVQEVEEEEVATQAEDETDTEKAQPAAQTKGIGEVVALADIAGYLDFLVFAFGQNGVSEQSVSKMIQALDLLIDVIHDESAVGTKSFTIDKELKLPEHKSEPKVDTKAQLEALRAHMQQSDKSIGLALKTMKDLLAKGGE